MQQLKITEMIFTSTASVALEMFITNIINLFF